MATCALPAEDHDEEEDEGEEEDTDEDEELGNISAEDLQALAAYGRKHGMPLHSDDEVSLLSQLPGTASPSCMPRQDVFACRWLVP